MSCKQCFVSVSDLALCQRCPALLAYKIHKNEKSAWCIGIKGSGDPYGSIFHNNIAQVFFEAASNPNHELHEKILRAIPEGYESLKEVVRENIFMPYMNKNSTRLKTGQIFSMASGIEVWVKAMSDFFKGIPSLLKNPEKNMQTVFIRPEGKLQGVYNFSEDQLVICGRYDALMFNPDKAEARLFEFKGFQKSDITVSLSQSLIYSWLIEKSSGIVPSVEIIYLDEHKNSPVIFASKSVKEMIKTGLPNLFNSAFNIISLRRPIKILRNENLCPKCKFKSTCKNDISNMFGLTKIKRRGASLLSVMIFFLAAVMIMAQTFFFSSVSSEALKDDRELTRVRMILTQRVEDAKTSGDISFNRDKVSQRIGYNDFAQTSVRNFNEPQEGKFYVNIHNLYYDFDNTANPLNDFSKNMHRKIFPPMGAGHYLIRAFTKLHSDTGTERTLMYQVLVEKNSSNGVITKSFEEIWYQNEN